MAPATKIPQTQRTTRSSTLSQTSKSHHDAQAEIKPARTNGTGRIDKHRPNPTDKARRLAGSETKPRTAPRAESERSEAEKGAAEPDTSNSTPDNVTVFTVESTLVKSPIICHEYAPLSTAVATNTLPHVIFTHGAGGTLSAPAVVNFCTGFSSVSTSSLFAFQGSTNLGSRVKGFHACRDYVYRDDSARSGFTGGKERSAVFGGRSMGARAAVIAATELEVEMRGKQGGSEASVRLVLVSYPLQGPKDVRDQILLDLPESFQVLFIVGDTDAMCPLELLERAREKMRAKSRLIVMRGADHGMNVRPTSKTREIGEQTGRAAARWLSGKIEGEGETLHMGREE